MIKSLVSLSDLGFMRMHPYQRTAWFVLSSLQREHALNMQAWSATSSSQIVAAWLNAVYAAAGMRPERSECQIGDGCGSSRSQ